MKKIIYFVGCYGCGKTTAVKKFGLKTARSDIIIEDKTTLDIVKQVKIKNMPIIENYMLMSYYSRILSSVNQGTDYIFVDGHPLLMSIYLRANFELENGVDVTLRDLLEFGRIKFQMWKITKDLLRDYDQEIIYINLPINENYELVEQRFPEREKDFPFEIDTDWFKAIRRVLHSEIYHIGTEMYGCSITEINSLEQLDSLSFGVPNQPLPGG